jgi:YVTN family beta-propeller protein
MRIPWAATVWLLWFTGEVRAGPVAFVTNEASNTVSMIDLASNEAVEISVGVGAYGVQIHPNGVLVYVTNALDGTLSVVNVTSAVVENTIPVGSNPHGVAITPSADYLYVAATGDGAVNVIDLASNTVVDDIPVGRQPVGIISNPTGTRLYVANEADDTVSVINTSTNSVTAVIAVGAGPQALAMTPSGGRLYVASTRSPDLTIIDPTINLAVGRVTMANPCTGDALVAYALAITPDGKTAFVTENSYGPYCYSGRGLLGVADLASDTQVTTLLLGTEVRGVAVTPDGSRVYAVNNSQGPPSMAVFDVASLSHVADILLLGQAPVAFGSFIGNVLTTTTTSTLPSTTTTTTLPVLDEATRLCQKALGKSFARVGAKAHKWTAACLDALLADLAQGGLLDAATAMCRKRLDMTDASSSLSRARVTAKRSIATVCSGVSIDMLANRCDPNAVVMEEVADCVLTEQALAAVRAISAEYGAACSLLQSVGLAQFSPICPPG